MDLLYQNPAANSIGSSIISLANYVVLTYFSKYYCVCLIKTPIDYIFINEAVPTIVITVDEAFGQSFQNGVDKGCQAFMVHENALWPFLDMFITVHDDSDQRFSGKSLIIFLDSMNTTTLQQICEHQSIKELPDMLIIVHQDESIEFYTTSIFSDGSRGNTFVEIRPITPPEYFPDKSMNMNGVPIRFRTVMYPPFVYYEETTAEKANARYDPRYGKGDRPVFVEGSEGLLLPEFCIKYNCTVEAYFDEDWGEVYENHTGTGMVGAVATRQADFGVSAIYHWLDPYRFATYTVPISRSGVTVIVPKPQIIAPWRTPFLSFSGYLWIAVCVTFVVAVCAVWLIEKGRCRIIGLDNEQPKSISDCILTLIGFYMEQTAHIRNDLMSCVILFTSLLFAGFMVGNMYGAGLAGIMTIPQHEHAIDTVVDLADSGMTWMGFILAWLLPIMSAPQPYIQTLVKNYIVRDTEYMQNRAKQHDSGFVGERTEYGHFVPIDHLDHESAEMMQLLKDDLFWESCVAIVTKTSPFKHHFNDFLMTIRQSGVQHYWERRAAYRYINMTVERIVLNGRQSSGESEAEALTTLHFLGAFFILALGIAFGMLLLILECTYAKLTQNIIKTGGDLDDKQNTLYRITKSME